MNYRPGQRRRLIAGLLTITFLLIAGGFCARTLSRFLYPRQHCEAVERYSAEFGVDSDLVSAVIRTESGFDPTARSEVGAMGLMQIMPDTFGWLQGKLEPDAALPAEALYDPETNIRYGVYYLSMLEDKFGDESLTIAAYHAGQNRVAGWLADGRVYPGCTADDIPSAVTGHYVRKVQRALYIYKELYDR